MDTHLCCRSWVWGKFGCTAATAARRSILWSGVSLRCYPDRVTILAQNAIKPEEINAGDAQKELEAGEKLYSDAGEDPEKYAEANEVIHEAQVKLESAKK